MPRTSRQLRDMIPSRKKKTIELSTPELPIKDTNDRDDAQNDIPSAKYAPSMSTTASTIADTASNTTTLIGHESGIPEVYYTSVEQFFQEYRRFCKEGYSGFCVHGVSSGAVESIIERQDQDQQSFRIQLFLPDAKLLMITIPTRQHEDLHLRIYDKIADHIRHGGYSWASTGSTTYPGHKALRVGLGLGQGDSGGLPEDVRPFGDDWPTLVVEAGWSQTIRALRQVMRWWFETSQHQVKIVILTSFQRVAGSNQIVVEKWIEAPRQSGIMESSRSAVLGALSPVLDHTITIDYRGPEITAQSIATISLDDFIVTRNDMVIELAVLLLRDTQTAQDCVLTEAFWKDFGRRVWFSRVSRH